MKITIEFDTDNAAFEENYPGEVGFVIRQAHALVEDGGSPGDYFYVKDTNGNTIGEVRFS